MLCARSQITIYICFKNRISKYANIVKENCKCFHIRSSPAVSELSALSPLTSQLLPQSVYFQEFLVFFEDDIEEAANLGHVDV